MPKIKTVTTPVKIKEIVAVNDLIENLLMPHTPWPLVQPFPILVPMPTNNPPVIIKGKEFVKTLSILFPDNENKIGPIIKPNKNNKLSILFILLKIPSDAIELTPLNLPLKIKNIKAAKPISKPPVKSEYGVKFIMFINFLKLEIQG